jgi:hypothetical protein
MAHINNEVKGLRDGLLVIILACIYIAAFLSALPAIQAQPYGVAMFAFLLAIFMYGVNRGFSAPVSESVPGNILAVEKRPLHIVAVISIALGVSWYANDFDAALNPVGYWRERAQEKYPCEFTDQLLARAAMEFQVEHNKFQRGLATSFDVKDKADAITVIEKIASECQRGHADRKGRAKERLKELKL